MQRRSIDARISTQQMEGLVKVACAAIRELARLKPGELINFLSDSEIDNSFEIDNSVEEAFAFIDECRARFDAYDEADAAPEHEVSDADDLPEDWQCDYNTDGSCGH